MKTYEFTIIATGLDPHAEDFEARFYEAGCDDALVSFQKGRILVDFAREAASLADAIASAVEHCRAAGAVVEHVEPDPLVSLTEIAHRSNLTKAAISNYYRGQRGEGFPAPKIRVTSTSPLWDWLEVSTWLVKNERLDRDIALGAAVFSAANDALGAAGCFRERLHARLEELTSTL